jgi:hypothetical protein
MMAVEPLNLAYKFDLQLRCFTGPAGLCEHWPHGNCADQLVSAVTNFVDGIDAQLPDEIDSDGFMPRHYALVRARMSLPVTTEPWCLEIVESSEVACLFIAHLLPALSAFEAARMANIDLLAGQYQPYLDPERDRGVPPSEWSPVNCISAVNKDFPWMQATCVKTMINGCLGQVDSQTCLDAQIAQMDEFLVFARATFPIYPDLSGYDLETYRRDLEAFDRRLSNPDNCDGSPELSAEGMAQLCSYTNYGLQTAAALRIGMMFGPNYLSAQAGQAD